MTYREPSRPWGLHSCLPVLGSPCLGGAHSEQHGRHGPGTLHRTLQTGSCSQEHLPAQCATPPLPRTWEQHMESTGACCCESFRFSVSSWVRRVLASSDTLASRPSLQHLPVLSVTSDHSAVCGWASNIRGPKNLAPQRGYYHRPHPVSPGARKFTRASL